MVLVETGSTSLGPSGADTPKYKHVTQQYVSTSIRKAERSQTQLQRIRLASISTFTMVSAAGSSLIFGPHTQASSAGVLTWSWPGTSLACCGQTAGCLSSSLCPPCRAVQSSIDSAVQPPDRHTWEVRRCWDIALPLRTVGKMSIHAIAGWREIVFS